jgi:hypothetical protein
MGLAISFFQKIAQPARIDVGRFQVMPAGFIGFAFEIARVTLADEQLRAVADQRGKSPFVADKASQHVIRAGGGAFAAVVPMN